MKRRLVAAGAVVALVVGGGAWVGLGSAASAGDSGLRAWPGSKASAEGDVSAAAAKGGGDGRTLVVYSRELRGAEVDVGRNGFGPGDYFVFEEALFNRAGKRIGGDSVRCMLMVRTFRCDGTGRIWGVGKIEISGSVFWERDNRYSITGGTGRYAGAGGTLRVFDEPGGRSRLEFHFAD